MKNPPRTMEEAEEYYYRPEELRSYFWSDQCAWEVIDKRGEGQCYRKPGHGPGGLYCWQHARMVEREGK